MAYKVGILTFHNGFNYGAFFQVYAMQKFLQSHGFEVQVINYKNFGFTQREYQIFLSLRNPLASIRNLQKIINFQKAFKHLILTKRIYRSKNLNRFSFDRIIIGSDEVWNCESELIGCDPVYFSDGLNADRYISYAASFGTIRSCEAIPQHLRSKLKRIEFFSVRDENSAIIIKSLTQQAVSIVLDPTFLVDFKSEAAPIKESHFILIYGFDFPEEIIQQIKSYANSVHKKVISVGYAQPWCDYSFDTLNPFQWLGYFQRSDCIFTTMFHGMIFSVLNKKDFYLISTPYRRHKVGNFLEDLGLSDRFLEIGDCDNFFAKPIDYELVDDRLVSMRTRSENFLLNALN